VDCNKKVRIGPDRIGASSIKHLPFPSRFRKHRTLRWVFLEVIDSVVAHSEKGKWRTTKNLVTRLGLVKMGLEVEILGRFGKAAGLYIQLECRRMEQDGVVCTCAHKLWTAQMTPPLIYTLIY
jgi:hypothetical protein